MRVLRRFIYLCIKIWILNTFSISLCAQNNFECLFEPAVGSVFKKVSQNQVVKDTVTGIYTIPVVVHVIYKDSTDNISDAQIQSAIQALTIDFRKQNQDTILIVPPFDKLAADSKIEFRLAKKDPSGLPTNGITRTHSDSTGFGFLWDAYYDSTGGKTGWPPNEYLNIRVVKSFAGLYGAGRANFVGGPPNLEGVIICRGLFNSIPIRVLTHEVGHYFHLYHLWGMLGIPGDSTNCSKDDSIADTPNCWGGSYYNGTITGDSAVSCGTLNNTQNYMDYNPYKFMFTKGQVLRMQNILNSSSVGANLHSYNNLIKTGLLLPALVKVNQRDINIEIYPNPTKGDVVITCQRSNSEIFLSVYNYQSELVLSKNLIGSVNTINLSSYPSGLYLFQFSTGNELIFKKCMKY